MEKFPIRLELYDYHGFDDAKEHYNKIDKNIKVKEIDFDGFTYFGIVYKGSLKDRKNKALINEIKKHCKESIQEIKLWKSFQFYEFVTIMLT